MTSIITEHNFANGAALVAELSAKILELYPHAARQEGLFTKDFICEHFSSANYTSELTTLLETDPLFAGKSTEVVIFIQGGTTYIKNFVIEDYLDKENVCIIPLMTVEPLDLELNSYGNSGKVSKTQAAKFLSENYLTMASPIAINEMMSRGHTKITAPISMKSEIYKSILNFTRTSSVFIQIHY
jgi:hypothetical protein